jgi:ParB/RepB/Spo0J family partition protein
MPKNFGSANTSTAFREVGKEYAERGNVISLLNISSENLIDHPDNGEDITRTSDLEASISELGFIDPIEVTTRGVDDGNYMIVSGRRRRAAGIKVGISTFPCLLRNFESDSDVQKYILFANQHRDSDSDPLLLARRYKMHKAQLDAEGFKGAKRNEIARRMNLSAAQADRYEALNNIIEPVWVMISEGKIGVSSVQKMATHSEDEQLRIYNMLLESYVAGEKLTRDKVDEIIEQYRGGVAIPTPQKTDKVGVGKEKTARVILRHTEKLSACLKDLQGIDGEEAEKVVVSMGELVVDILGAIDAVSDESGADMCREILSKVQARLEKISSR